MPLYDYDCAACGRRFETIHGVYADPPDACPLCGGGPIRKTIAAAAVHFKGSGWAKKERRATVPSGAGSKTGEDSTGDPGTASKGDGAPGSKDGGGPSSTGSEPAGGAKGSGAKEGSPPSTTSATTSSSTTPTPPTTSD